MRKCAICHQTDVKFTNEHVIPDALGGCCVQRQMVCVNCNSKMGHTINAALVNHVLSDFFRWEHRLKGKRKNMPNPFAGEHTLLRDSGRKVNLRDGPRGSLIPYIIPQVKRKSIGKGMSSVNITLDSTDKCLLEPIVQKIANRLGGSHKEALAGAQRTTKSNNGEILVQLAFDTKNYKIGLLKIAYEFAVERIPAYVNSCQAIEFAKILKNEHFEEVERYVNIGNGLQRSIMDPFAVFLSYEGLSCVG